MNMVCTRCDKTKSAEKFEKRRGKRGPWCKTCRSDYARLIYQRHKVKTRKRIHARNRRIMRENRRRVAEQKHMAACLDCGEKHPHWKMQFDHLDPKLKLLEISLMVSHAFSWERIQQEMLLCELVCANCHADRTFKRAVARGIWKDPLIPIAI
jgi:hypothetical protein